MKRALLAFMVYLIGALIVTFPLITHFDTRIVGHPFGDSTEYLRHAWWIAHALQTGQPIFDQPLLLYPDGLNGALLWSIPLQSFPVWALAFVMPLAAAFNGTALLYMALNGTAMAALVHVLLGEKASVGAWGRTAGAFVAGTIFMAYPAFQGQLALGHLGLLAAFPAPLLIAALWRLQDAKRPYPLIAAAAVLFAACGWGSIVLFIYLVAPLLAGLVFLLIVRRKGGALRRIGIALMGGVALALVFVLPGLATPLTDSARAVQYSASLLSVVSPSFAHPVWGAVLDYPRAVLGVDPFEGAAYIGVIAGVLALIGLIRVPAARLWGGIALVAWIASLGGLLKGTDAPISLMVDGYATFVTLPGALLDRLPLLELARTPARFNLAVGFAAAIMAGYGIGVLTQRTQRRRERGEKQGNEAEIVTQRTQRYREEQRKTRRLSGARAAVGMGIAALILFDYQQFFPVPTIPAAIPDAIYQIAQSDARAVFNVPFAHPLTDKDGMYLQTAHQTPIIAGHIARETPLDPARGWLLEGTLDPALLDAAGVDVIILHKDWDDADGVLDARLRAAFGAPIYEDARIARFDLPAYDGAPPEFLTYMRTDGARTLVYSYTPAAGYTTTITGDPPCPRAASPTLICRTIERIAP